MEPPGARPGPAANCQRRRRWRDHPGTLQTRRRDSWPQAEAERLAAPDALPGRPPSATVGRSRTMGARYLVASAGQDATLSDEVAASLAWRDSRAHARGGRWSGVQVASRSVRSVGMGSKRNEMAKAIAAEVLGGAIFDAYCDELASPSAGRRLQAPLYEGQPLLAEAISRLERTLEPGERFFDSPGTYLGVPSHGLHGPVSDTSLGARMLFLGVTDRRLLLTPALSTTSAGRMQVPESIGWSEIVDIEKGRRWRPLDRHLRTVVVRKVDGSERNLDMPEERLQLLQILKRRLAELPTPRCSDASSVGVTTPAREPVRVPAPTPHIPPPPSTSDLLVATPPAARRGNRCRRCGGEATERLCAICGELDPAAGVSSDGQEILGPVATLLGLVEDSDVYLGDGYLLFTFEGVRTRVGTRDDDNNVPALEIETYWGVPEELEFLLSELARFASLSNWYSSAQMQEHRGDYAWLSLRPCDLNDDLVHLALTALATQHQEVTHRHASLGIASSPGSCAERIAPLLPPRDQAMSFNRDLDAAEARWRAVGHHIDRRGEYFRLFSTRPVVVINALLQDHPSWGHGLFVSASVPLSEDAYYTIPEWEQVARDIAVDDRRGWTVAPNCDLLGSWCADVDDGAPTFVSFVPEQFWRPGLAVRMVDQALGKFAWLTALTQETDCEWA